MPSALKKTCRLIVESGNHYLGALKRNQKNLYESVRVNFVAEESYVDVGKGHGRIERRVVSRCSNLEQIPDWPGLQTLIRVESQRQLKKGGQPHIETETRYLLSSLRESAKTLARRIRGYWGVENKVHHVRDVTQGEDASRIRMHQLPQLFAVARNFALNLYRSDGSQNMAQAERYCKYGLGTLQRLFRMK